MEIMSLSQEQIEQRIVDLIARSNRRLTSRDIEKSLLVENIKLPKRAFTSIIKSLIENEALAYTYEYGSSFIEPSFDKPVRITEHIIIKPEGCSISHRKEDIVVSLQKGVSFGSGRHATTRLALRALESVLYGNASLPCNIDKNALDIGTGSGILAIAAALMGAGKVIACDIDSCARSEAMHNFRLNGLTDRAYLDSRPFECIQEKFFLIMANLRLPTLADIHEYVSQKLENNGFAIFSGLKSEEVELIINLYQKENITVYRQFEEKGWASVILHKKG